MPLNLQVVVDESNICTLSWQTPVTAKRHGTLINYLIICTVWRNEDDYNITIYTNDTDQTLVLSQYASYYTCCISGVNEAGVGDPACQPFITYESGIKSYYPDPLPILV